MGPSYEHQVYQRRTHMPLVAEEVRKRGYVTICTRRRSSVQIIQTVPEGFDVIELNAGKYLAFRESLFEEEEYCEAIEQVQHK